MTMELVDIFGLCGKAAEDYAHEILEDASAADDLYLDIMGALDAIGREFGEDELEWHVYNFNPKTFSESRGLHLKYKES